MPHDLLDNLPTPGASLPQVLITFSVKALLTSSQPAQDQSIHLDMQLCSFFKGLDMKRRAFINGSHLASKLLAYYLEHTDPIHRLNRQSLRFQLCYLWSANESLQPGR